MLKLLTNIMLIVTLLAVVLTVPTTGQASQSLGVQACSSNGEFCLTWQDCCESFYTMCCDNSCVYNQFCVNGCNGISCADDHNCCTGAICFGNRCSE